MVRIISNGKRDEWEFEHMASKLAEGAAAQKAHQLSRVEWWTAAKERLMAEVRESGLEVSESVATGLRSSTLSQIDGPQITVRHDLQKKLAECHGKIQSHRRAVAEYDGWEQVLRTNPESRLKLTQADWLYFFGKA